MYGSFYIDKSKLNFQINPQKYNSVQFTCFLYSTNLHRSNKETSSYLPLNWIILKRMTSRPIFRHCQRIFQMMEISIRPHPTLYFRIFRFQIRKHAKSLSRKKYLIRFPFLFFSLKELNYDNDVILDNNQVSQIVSMNFNNIEYIVFISFID